MLFELILAPEGMHVEGRSDAASIGSFRGTVLAIGVTGSDPVASAAPVETATTASGEEEGMLGWGTTYFLVSDPTKSAPVWVAKAEVERHQLDRDSGSPVRT